MTRRPRRRARPRGTIDALPSGAFRVRVYAGVDPLTGKRHDLVELAASPTEAQRVRTRLPNQVDERRNSRTEATISQLMDRYLDVVAVEDTTRWTYES